MPYTELPVINSSYDSECGIRFDNGKRKPKKQDKSDDNGEPDNFIWGMIMDENNISGMHIYYYYVCKRKLWYFSNGLQWKVKTKMSKSENL